MWIGPAAGVRPVSAIGWRLIRAVVLTLGAGALMMASGYLLRDGPRAVAGYVTLPAGPLISAAFATIRPRAERGGPSAPARRSPWARARRGVLTVVGMPWPGAQTPLRWAIAAMALALLAGLAMTVAGYTVAAGDWLVSPPLVLLGGLIIAGAFLVSATSGD